MRHHRPRTYGAGTAALRWARIAAARVSIRIGHCDIGSRLGHLGLGVGLLMAAACGRASTAPSEATIATIVVSPDSVSLPSGSGQALTARARTASGAPLSGAQFFWSTSDSLVATVDQSGNVRARQPGVAQIGASAQGVSGLADVIVVEPVVKSVVVSPSRDTIYATHPGDTATLSASADDADGHPIPGSPLFWSTNSGLVTVSNGAVVATGSGAGTATVTATSPDSGYPAGSASVVVIGHVASTTVSPTYSWLSTTGSFFLPQSERLTATLIDTFGHSVTGQRALAWSSSNPAVATVSQSGVVTAVTSSGTSVLITARTADGSTGSATVTVFP